VVIKVRKVELTHAVLGIKIIIFAHQIFGAYWSESQKASMLLSTGSTVVPVKENIEQLTKLIDNLNVQEDN
jgi:hypothetical protein